MRGPGKQVPGDADKARRARSLLLSPPPLEDHLAVPLCPLPFHPEPRSSICEQSIAMESESARVAVRSCLVCAKAKARCVRRLGEDVCERYPSCLGKSRARLCHMLIRCLQLRETQERMSLQRTSRQKTQAGQDNVSLPRKLEQSLLPSSGLYQCHCATCTSPS